MKNEWFKKVNNPSWYLGNEFNTVRKENPELLLRFCLSFPDLYPVGMSYLGFSILYSILNGNPSICAERVFAPAPDMAEILLAEKFPLASLETKTPLKEFDIAGFTLQYEMSYSTILWMLKLAGIPLKSCERDESFPLVIAGGPNAFNPEPVADFFDFFVIGDGEEIVLEISERVLRWKKSGKKDKTALLKELSKLKGIYVPSFYTPVYDSDGLIKEIKQEDFVSNPVERIIISDINYAHFPEKPVIPFSHSVHDRLSVEITRGCTKGCRFCQAGMIYRPVRERSVRNICKVIENSLSNTGYEEISLLSLSTGDYCGIESLISRIIERYRDEKIALSLPSLRVSTLTEKIISDIKSVRKTGFTIAPEAGSERLRKVINKGVSEEDLLAAVRKVFEAGWKSIKLYFMIGLPSETFEDVEEIVALARKAKKSAKGGFITVSVSNFVPKPFTPFQWEPFEGTESLRDKIGYLSSELKRHRIDFKWHNVNISLMEAIFSRGDRMLAVNLASAVNSGVRLEGWSENFRIERWKEAFDGFGKASYRYALRKRGFDELFPWDIIDAKLDRGFLISESEKALEAVETADCRFDACSFCGVCDFEKVMNCIAESSFSSDFESKKEDACGKELYRYRFRYTKCGLSAFFGHLELSNIIQRGLRFLKIPVDFSKGFHPLPKISFSPPLPVGVESEEEYFDAEIKSSLDTDEIRKRLNCILPEGLTICEIFEISLQERALFDSISKVSYLVFYEDGNEFQVEKLSEKVLHFFGKEFFIIERARKAGIKKIDLRKIVDGIAVEKEMILLDILFTDEGSVKPSEVLTFVLDFNDDEIKRMKIVKKGVSFKR